MIELSDTPENPQTNNPQNKPPEVTKSNIEKKVKGQELQTAIPQPQSTTEGPVGMYVHLLVAFSTLLQSMTQAPGTVLPRVGWAFPQQLV